MATEQQRKLMSMKKLGIRNPNYKDGSSIAYDKAHDWIKSIYGRATHCTNTECLKTSRVFDWSNKNHKYRKSLRDWQQLCRRCHKQYDRKKFGHLWKNVGKKVSDETRHLMSLSHKAKCYKISDEHKQKMSEAMKLYWANKKNQTP